MSDNCLRHDLRAVHTWRAERHLGADLWRDLRAAFGRVAINATACPAPPGLDTTNPENSNITTSASGPTSVADQPPAGTGTVIGDDDPTYDVCSYLPGSDRGDSDTPGETITMGGNNIGEDLTTSNITWGWFEGGFDNGYVPGTAYAADDRADLL